MKLLLRMAGILLLIATATALPALPALPAAPGGAAQAAAASPALQPATVVIMNRPIIVLRSTLYGYSPQERAENIELRIQAQIEKGVTGPVTTRAVPQGTMVLINNQLAITITPDDLNPLADETMSEVTERAVSALGLVLREAREQRSLPTLLKAVGLTAIATLLFACSLWIIRRSYRWLLSRLKKVIQPKLRKLAIGGSVFLTDMIAAVLRFVIGFAALLAVLFAANLWLTFSLHRFPYTRPWGEALTGYLITGLAGLAHTVIKALPGLLTVVLIIIVTRFVTRMVRRFFTAVETGQIKLPPAYAETAHPTSRLITAVMWLFALIMAYPYIPGSGTDAFKGVSIFVGLLVSLGSTGVVNHAASGLILMYARALSPGDYVRVGDTEGTVLSVGMLSTKIQTTKNENVNIPNAVMVNTAIKNYTQLAREEGVILYTSVTIGYDAPWRQVHALLLQAAERTAGLRKEPKPFVLQTALSDFYVEYQLNAYLKKPEERIPVLAELHAHIQDAFNEFGVQIMSPHYLTDTPAAKVVPKEKWYQPPAQKPDGQKTSPAE